MREDLERAVVGGWTRHFVAQNYVGDWSGIALRSIDAVPGHGESKPGVPASAYRDTAVLEGCAHLKQVLAQFQCPIGSARLLQLTAGSVIQEHTDHDLGYDHDVVRLHVPIQTHPEVEFFVEEERISMREGECWYIDTSLRHRVANRSPLSRVHLVFDCELNAWLRAQLAQAGFEPRPRDDFERRGLRRADVLLVIEQLRTLGGASAERLASELEQAAVDAGPLRNAAPSSPSHKPSPPAAGDPGWIPFDLVHEEGLPPALEWRFIGDTRFTDPWLEDTVRRNGPARNGGVPPRRTGVDALDELQPGDALQPRGLIFHASRAGSTLLTQMLACSPRLCVLAEPPIVESLIEWSHAGSPDTRAALGRRLRLALSQLGRRRHELEQGWIWKLESQHILELPLIEACFPQVPWIFLFRSPEEILRSQRRQRGRQMVPGMISSERLGVPTGSIDPARLDEYAALLLERTFEAALSYSGEGKGRVVHYRELPEYAWQELDTLFGLELTDTEVAAMRERSLRDAKHAGQLFVTRSDEAPILEGLPASLRERLELLYEQLLDRVRAPT